MSMTAAKPRSKAARGQSKAQADAIAKAQAANKAAAKSSTDTEDDDMTAAKPTAKKTATRKPATSKSKAPAKRTTAKKQTTRTRKPRAAAKPMSPESRKLAAAVVGFATEQALLSEDLGVKRSGAATLRGDVGQVARIVLDDGSRITVTVRVRQK